MYEWHIYIKERTCTKVRIHTKVCMCIEKRREVER